MQLHRVDSRSVHIPRALRRSTQRGVVLLGRDPVRSNGVAIPRVPDGFRFSVGSETSPVVASRNGFFVSGPIDYGLGAGIYPTHAHAQIDVRENRWLILDMSIYGKVDAKEGESLGLMLDAIPRTTWAWFVPASRHTPGDAKIVELASGRLYAIELPSELTAIQGLSFVGDTFDVTMFIRGFSLTSRAALRRFGGVKELYSGSRSA